MLACCLVELAEPAETQYDVHFKIGKIPVRIHPIFWLGAVLLGGALRGAGPAHVAMWVAAVTLSIVVHELGHALAAKAYGWSPRIVLHGLGGLAIYRPGQQSWLSRVAIAAAGPGAGFILGGVVVGIAVLTGHSVILPLVKLKIGTGPLLDGRLGLFVGMMTFINVFWGLVNLLPVQPLDGGHILAAILQKSRPRDGLTLSYQVSIGVAITVAVISLVTLGELFLAVMFGFLAYSAWSTLQQLRAAGY